MEWHTCVEEIMSSPPITIDAYSRLDEAAKKMYQNRVGSIVVVDESNSVVGILTKSDFLYFIASGIVKRNPRVAEVMHSEPVVAKPYESVGDAYERMKTLGIRHLPVVDDEGVVVGVLSMRDILFYVCKPQL
ncbi:MAG: CBS domain-containing protein [Desulfurococcales archaeon]|nr:CBS domain-containing protein [Desulfurococcales archaeon]